MFFVLSGFVLTLGSGERRTWAEFFTARAARIWPSHIAVTALFIAAFWPWSAIYFQTLEWAWRLTLNILLVQDWSPDPRIFGSFNGVTWSLSAELFFYAAFPIAVVAMKRSLTGFAIGATAISLTFAYAGGALFPNANEDWMGVLNPVSGFFAFALGMIAARLFDTSKTTRSINPSLLELASIAAAIGMNAALHLTISTHPNALSGFLHRVSPSIGYAICIYVLALQRGIFSRLLSARWVVYLGEVSFCFYLVHQLVLRRADAAHAFGHHQWAIEAMTMAILSLIIAMIVHHAVEEPARKYIVRRLVAWKAPVSQAPIVEGA